ncbi:MAG TPA: ATP-grasp domain-containing protein [Tepidisphaeraceae bacterium]|jgi:D-alanine-D-alanine ligase
MSKARAKPKPLRVLVLMDKPLVPPESVEGMTVGEIAPFKTELDVCTALTRLGHEVYKLGVQDDLAVIRNSVDAFHPHIAFNLLEGFRDFHVFDQHVVSYLELIEQPYTGCNPRGMTLARDKALTKKIMAYHRIHVPAFAVFPRRRQVARPKKLGFPLVVKSVNVEGSVGIAQSSLVHGDDELKERVKYIHEALGTYAIAEQYIEGRELYVGVMGNLRLSTFPVWELLFEKAPGDMPVMATEKAKWDSSYQRRWGITTRQATDLPAGHEKLIPHLCKRIYRILGLTGYARLDFRMTSEGELYLLEANPNPQLAHGEDFADSAAAAGVEYDRLLQQICTLGLQYSPRILS